MDFFEKLRRLSHRELKDLMALCAGASFLIVAALVLSGSLPFLPQPLKVAIKNVNPNSNAAAVYSSVGTRPFVVPNGVASLVVKMWGGGGYTTSGSCYASCNGYTFCSYGGPGGGGGYTSATIPVTPGQQLTIVVGGPTSYSGVFSGTTPSQATALVIAGAGGNAGGGSCVGGNPGCGANYSCSGYIPSPAGGPGGGLSGGSSYNATGGTQTAGGTGAGPGGALVGGGPGTNGGAGGAGWYGGGGGAQIASQAGSGGAGGAGYCSPAVSNCSIVAASGSTAAMSQTAPSGAGNASNSGAIIILNISAAAQLSLTATPPTIQRGNSSQITWTANGTSPASCTVTGPAPWTTWNQLLAQFTGNTTYLIPSYSSIGGTLAVYVYGAGGGGGGGGTGGPGGSNGSPGSATVATTFNSATPLVSGPGGGGGAGLNAGNNGANGGPGTATGGDAVTPGGGSPGGGGGGGLAGYSGYVGGSGGSGGYGGYVYKAWTSASPGAPAQGANIGVTVGAAGGGGGPNGGAGAVGKVIISRGVVSDSQSTGVFGAVGNYTYTLTCTAPENGSLTSTSTTVVVNAACPANYADNGGVCVCQLNGLGGLCVASCTDPNSHATGGNCVCNDSYFNQSGSCMLTAPASIVTFSASPSRVHKGVSTSVPFTWKVTNPPASCTISGPAGFTALTISPVDGVAGSQVGTVKISQASVFTLTCGAVSVQTTIGLIPTVKEL